MKNFLQDTTGSDNWYLKAACNGIPTDWFFSTKRDNTNYNELKPICRSCPVRKECFNDVMEFETSLNGLINPHGFVAGLTPNQRKKIYRESKQAG